MGRHISSWIELHNQGVQTIRMGYLSWDMYYFILMSMARAGVLRWAKALVCWFFSVHPSSISKHCVTGNKQGCRSSGLNKRTVPTLAIPLASQDKKKNKLQIFEEMQQMSRKSSVSSPWQQLSAHNYGPKSSIQSVCILALVWRKHTVNQVRSPRREWKVLGGGRHRRSSQGKRYLRGGL